MEPGESTASPRHVIVNRSHKLGIALFPVGWGERSEPQRQLATLHRSSAGEDIHLDNLQAAPWIARTTECTQPIRICETRRFILAGFGAEIWAHPSSRTPYALAVHPKSPKAPRATFHALIEASPSGHLFHSPRTMAEKPPTGSILHLRKPSRGLREMWLATPWQSQVAFNALSAMQDAKMRRQAPSHQTFQECSRTDTETE